MSIDAAIQDLRTKLANAGSFFRGAVFRLEAGSRALSPDERHALSSTMKEFGVILQEVHAEEPKGGAPVVHTGERKSQTADTMGHEERAALPGGEEAVLVRRTLRSGQRVEYPGNVVIMGDVNPGAVVICSGDIVVLGALRGVAHAGAEGNTEAVVMAFRLQPTQLRIAHLISRAPDDAGPRPDVPEVARVRNEAIVIEAYSGQA